MQVKNSNFWENSKTQIVMKFQYSNCDETNNSICDETQKLKLR